MLNICAAVLLCGCYNSTRLPDGEGAELHPNMSLAELRKLWSGETFEIQDDVVVGGVVTSSDKEGNFYQTFTISDNTGAAEIMAGMRDLHNPYPVMPYSGTTQRVCCGCWTRCTTDWNEARVL